MRKLPQRAYAESPHPKQEANTAKASRRDALESLALPSSRYLGKTRKRSLPSVRCSVLWYFLFTTDAASESRAGSHALPSGEEENERSEVKKYSTLLSLKTDCELDRSSTRETKVKGTVPSWR